MDWERMQQQLGKILQSPVVLTRMTAEEWNAECGVPAKTSPPPKNAVHNGKTEFFLESSGRHVQVLTIKNGKLTGSEMQLIELLLDGWRLSDKSKAGSPAAEEERKALLIKDWYFHQLELGNTNAEMPDMTATQLSLYKTKIPLLLYGDYSDAQSVHYRDLKKLLESFFEAEIILVPLLEKEWLILGSESLLAASGGEERDSDEEESLEDSLASICYGLHEMLSNEWVGECHLSIHYPMTPAKSLLSTVLQMRETMMLGRTFNVGSNIHFPWMLHLEKLLNGLPDADKYNFIEHVFKHYDHVLDAETQSTLEHFFALDCNVSETAKMLYIHRNTLLYRLDKFKQETGLDVRDFNDAVLVKIALLLYKVTKRK